MAQSVAGVNQVKGRSMFSPLSFESDSLNGRRDVPQFLPGVVYQASPRREADLAAELEELPRSGNSSGVFASGKTPGGNPRPAQGMGSFVYRANPPVKPVFWWRNLWKTPFIFSFSSIKKAAAVLRSLQRNWACVPQGHYGRARLIQDALPYIAQKRRPLDYVLPDAPVGSWTLAGEHTILASASCASPFPGGIIEFEEDKYGPPSRAYLKLAEAFVRLGARPAAGETCLDAGASPGGWTWMAMRGFLSEPPVVPVVNPPHGLTTGYKPWIQPWSLRSAQTPEAKPQCGFAAAPQIIAVDRSPLAPRVAAIPNVTFLRHDAFTLRPEDIGMIDWLFCDAACYPARLYAWIEKWLASGLCKNYICTIKMQGAGGMETVRLFAAIPGGAVVHLYHDKHELTWMMRSVI
jgi:23S rRNA (cytidine2498-2'-O)-methyltransferase